MVDQGKLAGPSLVNVRSASDMYTSNPLSIWKFIDRRNNREPDDGIKAPFATAKWGPRPVSKAAPWTINRNYVPLGKGLPKSLFEPDGVNPYP